MLEIEIRKGATPGYPNIHEDEPVITAPSIFNPDAPGPWNDFNPVYTPSVIDTADDRFKREAEANLKRNTGNTTTTPDNTPVFSGGGGGGGSVAPAPQNVTLTPRDLSQRTPSGTMYAPDLSAYNDSSLFNYTGPGGLSEYTYGQNLPYQGADYSIWGTPADMVNPYYTGQFATEQAAGVADGAISLPPIDLPAGVSATNNNPSVGTSTTNFDPYKGEDILNKNVTKTTFPSPGGANPTLSERQRAQIGAEKWDAMVAQVDAWDKQMREGQLGNIPEGLLDVPMNSGLEWFEDTNNPMYMEGRWDDDYDPIEGGEWEARKNFLNEGIWANDYDLGRPGDPSYEEFQPTIDYGPLAQAKADQMMANLTKEELRDGLFIEPQLKVVDGEIVGKMGIPDIFTQDKGFGNVDLFADDGWSEFDPDNPYAEPSESELPLVVGNDNNYYNLWDDLMLEPVIPATQDASEYAAEQEASRLAQAQADAKAAQEAQAKYAREQMAARDAVLAAQAAAQAQAEAQAQAKAREVEKQVNEARAQVKDVARKPVYTAPKSSMGAGSRWKPSWTGGF